MLTLDFLGLIFEEDLATDGWPETRREKLAGLDVKILLFPRGRPPVNPLSAKGLAELT